MIPVDSQTMREVAPHFSGDLADRQAKIIAAVGEVLRPTLESYDITTRLRIAHFLGQTCEESAGFRTTEEFASGEEYEGRKDLGNVNGGDGPRFKDRGLLQLTGRSNYREYGQAFSRTVRSVPPNRCCRCASPASTGSARTSTLIATKMTLSRSRGWSTAASMG